MRTAPTGRIVHRAAGECRWQIDHPSTDFPIAEQLETDLIVSICKAYETGRGIWHADDLEQVIAARDALKEASDAARESGIPRCSTPPARW